MTPHAESRTTRCSRHPLDLDLAGLLLWRCCNQSGYRCRFPRGPRRSTGWPPQSRPPADALRPRDNAVAPCCVVLSLCIRPSRRSCAFELMKVLPGCPRCTLEMSLLPSQASVHLPRSEVVVLVFPSVFWSELLNVQLMLLPLQGLIMPSSTFDLYLWCIICICSLICGI